MEYHRPALLDECLDALAIDPAGSYVDATFGGGGHSRAILEQLSTGKLIGFDQDPDAVENVPDDGRFTLIRSNFKFLKNHLKLYRAIPVDGVLADLGVSFHQFDVPERGFTTRFDAPLDMRMNPADALTAREVVNAWDEEALVRIFRDYGELRNARKVAYSVVQARENQQLNTAYQLKEAIAHCIERGVPKRKQQQFYSKVFQALRIEVNGELDALKAFLEQCSEVIKPGGILAVISYHSLEDRLVKQYLKTGKFGGELDKDFYGNPIRPFKPVSNKVIVPSEAEVEENPRSRSAKLRVAKKTEEAIA